MAVGAGDLTQAHVYHWLHVKGNGNQAVAILESEKAPLESRVWYRYPNQAGAAWEGDGRSPSIVARVLDDGSTQVDKSATTALMCSELRQLNRPSAGVSPPPIGPAAPSRKCGVIAGAWTR